MFTELIHSIEAFYTSENNMNENWGFLSMKEISNKNLKESLLAIHDILDSQSFAGLLRIEIDGEVVSMEDLDDYLKMDSKCAIHLNKLPFVENKLGDNYTQFFFSNKAFSKWSENLNPFDAENPINKKTPLKIIVQNLPASFGGPNILVCNENSNDTFDSFNYKLPTEKSITEIVHIISQNSIVLKPLNHLITFGSIENQFASYFFNNSAKVLSACLVSEFYNTEKIILRGIKRIQLQLSDSNIIKSIGLNYLTELREVVEWIYEDKVETRIKLFIDRVTLDLDFDKSFTEGLIQIISSSFQQAKERYNFVIIERKDQYLKELRDLLKDVKSQSELYSNKLRSLLSNLLRDMLAGFLLVGFSFFTKISEITKLNETKLIEFVFKGFAIYFIFSAIFQLLVDLFDINVSNKEIHYWKNVTREFIPQKEFENHIRDSLQNRKNSVWILYPIVLFVYFLIALLSWNFTCIWNSYIVR